MAVGRRYPHRPCVRVTAFATGVAPPVWIVTRGALQVGVLGAPTLKFETVILFTAHAVVMLILD